IRRRTLLPALCLLTLGLPTHAVEPAPPPDPRPKEYAVKLRYRLPTVRAQHVRYYDAMLRHLKAIGLKPTGIEDEDRADNTKNELTGTIAAANARKILEDPAVQGLLLVPADYKLPEDPGQRVRVRLQLAASLPVARQRVLVDQVLDKLAHLGFQE